MLSIFDPRLAGRRLLLGQHALRLLRAPRSPRLRAHEAFDTPPLSSCILDHLKRHFGLSPGNAPRAGSPLIKHSGSSRPLRPRPHCVRHSVAGDSSSGFTVVLTWPASPCSLQSVLVCAPWKFKAKIKSGALRIPCALRSAQLRAHEAFDTPLLSSAASATLQPSLLVSVKVCFAGIYVPLLARTLTRHCLRHSSLTQTLQALVRGPARPRTPASHPPAPLEGGLEGTRSMPLPPYAR